MDEDAELIARLTTRAGMVMEDMSLLAITMPSRHGNARTEALITLTDAAQTIASLLAAAASLDRQSGGPD